MFVFQYVCNKVLICCDDKRRLQSNQKISIVTGFDFDYVSDVLIVRCQKLYIDFDMELCQRTKWVNRLIFLWMNEKHVCSPSPNYISIIIVLDSFVFRAFFYCYSTKSKQLIFSTSNVLHRLYSAYLFE